MKDIKRSEPVTLPEVKEIFSKMDVEQLDQIQRWTFDYVSAFAQVEAKQARRMRSALIKECGLTDEEAVEIINIMPGTLAEIRSFTFGWRKLILAETLTKIHRIIHEDK